MTYFLTEEFQIVNIEGMKAMGKDPQNTNNCCKLDSCVNAEISGWNSKEQQDISSNIFLPNIC